MKFSICCVLLFACFGCQGPSSSLEEWMRPGDKPKILSTTGIIDDLVGQIGGEKIDHLSLIEANMDPHSYELVKGDDEKFLRAQLVFYNGLGLEHGASLAYHLKKHPNKVALGEAIQAHNQEAIILEKKEVDPHIWLDVALWQCGVEPIVEALSLLDPLNRSYYEEQGKKVKANLQALDEAIIMKMKSIPAEKRYLVTSHDAFNYFTRRYLGQGEASWKERFCAPEGLAPEGQLSCQDIQTVIDYVEMHHVSVIFPEANIGKDSLKKIAAVCKEKRCAVKIASPALYSDTLGAKSYQEMMEHNANTLWAAWMH
jgi:manganese/zinc/iron transport system substrate-binding protein